MPQITPNSNNQINHNPKKVLMILTQTVVF